MGCDIHAFFEIKVNGEWLLYDQPNLQRNYRLFTKMAGVRDYNEGIEPISKPKGLPSDISKIVKLEANYWNDDGHSHSWLSVDEIKEVIDWHKNYTNDFLIEHEQWFYLFGNGWGEWKEHPNVYPKEIEDIRLVFWFDN